MHQKDMYCFA